MTIRSAVLGIVVAGTAFLLDVLLVRRLVGPVPVATADALDSVLLTVLVAAVIVAIAAADVSVARATQWLDDRGLPPTDGLVADARTWLRRTRTSRAIGFAVVFVSGTAPAWLINVSGLQPGDPMRDQLLDLTSTWPVDRWSAPIAAYAVGAIVAEVTRRTTARPDGARVADLRPRPLAGYLQPFSLWVPRVLAGAALLTAAATAATGTVPTQGPGSWRLAALALLGLAINEAVLRGLLSRRQAASDATAIAFDDAARATTVHAVAGSAIGVLGALLGDHLSGVALATDGSLRQAMGTLALVLAVGSFGVWLGHGVGLAHRVRRGNREVVSS